MIGIWWIGLIVTLVVLVPIAVYLLHDLWSTARSIELYARGSLAAAGGIADHTQHIPALDQTIQLATEMLSAAESVARKLDAMATALATRAGGD